MANDTLNDLFNKLTNKSDGAGDAADAEAEAEAAAAKKAEEAAAAEKKAIAAEKRKAKAAEKKAEEEAAAAAAAQPDLETASVTVEEPEPEPVEEEAAVSTAVVPKTEATGADLSKQASAPGAGTGVAMMSTPLGQIGGQIDAADLIIPRASIVHGVGKLSEDFEPGSLVLDAEAEVVDMPDDKRARMSNSNPYLMIPLRAVKVFRENFDFNDPDTKDKFPREFLSEDDVVAAGGRVEFAKASEGNFRPALNLQMALVRKTADVTPEIEHYFVDSYGDESFCIANLRLTKTSFRVAGKILITDMARTLRRREGGMLAARYLCINERVAAGDNMVWTPKFRLLPDSNEKGLIQYFRDLLEG